MGALSTYSNKNATGAVGTSGSQELLSEEQVLQGVMNPTATALQVSLVTSGGVSADGATAANQVLMLAKMPALGTAGTQSADFISTQGKGYKGTCTLTRAANQTPYSIGDVVGGVGQLLLAGPVSADVLITSLRILYNVSALPTGLANMSMYFYGATPPSAIADNSPFTLGSGDRSAFIAHVDNIPFSALGIGTQTVQGQLDNIIEQFLCDSNGSLWFYLVTNQAFTPAANSETLSVVSRGLLP